MLLLVLGASQARAGVVRIDITRRNDFITHERLIARVYFALDPNAPANRDIADIAAAPRNAEGLVRLLDPASPGGRA